MPKSVYLSNTTGYNGYGAASDSNNGLSPSAPVATGAHAVTLLSAGDTLVLNNTTTPYQIDDGSGNGLNLGSIGVTVTGDPNFVNPGDKTTWAIIQGTGGSNRLVNLNGITVPVVLQYVALDGQNAGYDLIQPHNVSAGLTCDHVWFKNVTGRNCIAAPSGTGNVIAITNCQFDSTVTKLIATNNSYASLTISGCTASGNSGELLSQFPGNGNTVTSLTISNNSFTSFTGYPFHLKGGTITSFSCTFNTFNNSYGGVFVDFAAPITFTHFHFDSNTNTGTSTQPMLYAWNFTCTDGSISNNTASCSAGGVLVRAELASGITMSGNSLTVPLGVTADAAYLGPIGTNWTISGNTFTILTASSIHGLLIGSDGYLTDFNNSGGSITNQNLFDVSGNSFLAQQVTTSALTQSSRSSNVLAIQLQLAKHGNPTGAVTVAFYTNSAGAPGTLIGTATTTIGASSLTTSLQPFEFYFNTPANLPAATTEIISVTVTGGAVDSNNYFIVGRNATTTGGIYSTASTLNGSYTAQSSNALLYLSRLGTVPTGLVVKNNVVQATETGTTTVHGILAGSITAGTFDSNRVKDTSLCICVKDSANLEVKNNILATNYSSQAPIQDKGSRACTYENNSISNTSGASSACVMFEPDGNLGVNAWVADSTTIVQNNAIRGSASSGVGYIYLFLANTLGTSPTPTIRTNGIDNRANVTIQSPSYATWAAWTGAGFDAGSFNSDLLLTNDTNPYLPADFVPTLSSPLLFAGRNNITSVPVDFNGTERNANGDIGAVVYAAATNDIVCRVNSMPGGGFAYALLSTVNGGQMENLSTRATEVYASANYPKYAVTLKQQGSGPRWVGSTPYWIQQSFLNQDCRYTSVSAGTISEADHSADDPTIATKVWWSGTGQYVPPQTDSSGRPQSNMVQCGGSAVAAGAIPNAAAGAANGIPINGTNTGPVSWSGGWTITNSTGHALALSSTGGNGDGLHATANGTGSGLSGTGGLTGHGILATGGATSGSGFKGVAPTSGSGASFTGAGTFHGLHLIAGATGNGLTIVAGSTSGLGVAITTTSGDGVSILPTNGNAVTAAGQGVNKSGAVFTGGSGTGTGIVGNISGNIAGTVTVGGYASNQDPATLVWAGQGVNGLTYSVLMRAIAAEALGNVVETTDGTATSIYDAGDTNNSNPARITSAQTATTRTVTLH
jgi:hypothetical protein